MTGELIIIGIFLTVAILASFWLAEDIRDAFREPFGDIPEIPKIDEPKGD